MNIFTEFQKIKDGFDKVKRDVVVIRGDLLTLKDIKAEKSAEAYLLEEVRVLKDKVLNLETQGVNGLMYVGNRDSNKAHISNCPFAKKISEGNMIYFSNQEDAQHEGYDFCVCAQN